MPGLSTAPYLTIYWLFLTSPSLCLDPPPQPGSAVRRSIHLGAGTRTAAGLTETCSWCTPAGISATCGCHLTCQADAAHGCHLPRVSRGSCRHGEAIERLLAGSQAASRSREDNEGAEAARARLGAERDRQARGSHANGDFDVAARSGAGALFLSHHISFTFLMQE